MTTLAERREQWERGADVILEMQSEHADELITVTRKGELHQILRYFPIGNNVEVSCDSAFNATPGDGAFKVLEYIATNYKVSI